MCKGDLHHQAIFPQALPLRPLFPGAGCRQGRQSRRGPPIPSRTFTGSEDGVCTCERAAPGGMRSTLDGGVPAPWDNDRPGRAWGYGSG